MIQSETSRQIRNRISCCLLKSCFVRNSVNELRIGDEILGKRSDILICASVYKSRDTVALLEAVSIVYYGAGKVTADAAILRCDVSYV